MKAGMVTLTYQEGEGIGAPSTSRRAGLNSVAEEGSQDGPKTAYIDKLYKFKEEDADYEKCDLFFICQDGEVPAHRLVISNASKFIMAMQDDQPPWYPVYISVPDMPKIIVQTLVRLAYTGKITIPPSTTSDELFDAMSSLGWIHTDCLTASFTDSMNQDIESAGSNKTTESLETALKRKIPMNNKGDVGLSDGEDDGHMEVELPNVPLSDEDEITSKKPEKTPPKKNANALKGRRSARNSPKPNAINNNSSSPSKSVTALPKTTRRKVSPPVVPEAETSKEKPSKEISENVSKTENPKRGRKSNKVQENANSAAPSTSEESIQTANSDIEPSQDQEPVRSRTRTIRKPKKFDDAVILTPSKRKESPVKTSPIKSPGRTSPIKSPVKTSPIKSPTKVVNSAPVEEVETEEASNSTATDKTNATEPAKALPKTRRSVSVEKNANKITSYFARSVSKEVISDVVDNITEQVQKSEEGVSTTKSRKSSRADENNVEDNGIEITVENSIGLNEKDVSTPSLTPRNRAKSNASTKSDKEAGAPEGSNSNHDDLETLKTGEGAGKRKRSLEGSEDAEPDPESNAIPKRRGRKPSTLSNASKSSKASNPEGESTVDGEMDAPESAPKRKRTRQE